jgi:hypothetical protein
LTSALLCGDDAWVSDDRPPDLLPFDVPLGDALVSEGEASLVITDDMAASFLGGASRTLKGRLYLSLTRLAFRPPRGPYPQQVTVPLAHVRHAVVERRKILGLPLLGKALKVRASISGRELDLAFRVDEPEGWAVHIGDVLAGASAKIVSAGASFRPAGLADGHMPSESLAKLTLEVLGS